MASREEDDFLREICCACSALIQSCENIIHKRPNSSEVNVRPTPEEAHSWSKDMNNLLQSPYGRALFRAFLQKEYAEENLDFLLKVQEYRNLDSPRKRQKLAWRLYSNYVAIGAPNEVNLDILSRRVTDLAMITPHLSTFDAAQRRIFNLLQNDAYKRFLRWKVYEDHINCPAPQERPQSPSESSDRPTFIELTEIKRK